MKYLLYFGLCIALCSGFVRKDDGGPAVEADAAQNFQEFASQFHKDSLPYEVSVPSSMYMSGHKSGGGYFPFGKKYIPEERFSTFSRMTRSNTSYNSSILKTDSFTLLAYTIEESVVDFLAPIATTLATFDSVGKRIDKIEFACQCTPDNFKTGLIDNNHHIIIKEYKNKWLNDPKEKGYLGNKVIGNDLIKTTYYTLADNGHFVPATEKIGRPEPNAHHATRY